MKKSLPCVVLDPNMGGGEVYVVLYSKAFGSVTASGPEGMEVFWR